MTIEADTGIVTYEEQWEMFDNAARRHFDMSGQEFADAWDSGEFKGDDGYTADEPYVYLVAFMRPNEVSEPEQ